jgi:hypothetical protein
MLLYHHQSTRHAGKRIKGKQICSAVPQSKAQLQDHHSLHLLFTTMLHKSLVSFIAAFAVATSVTASAIPVARNDGSECNTGTLQCCDSTAYSNDPVLASLASLLDIALPVDASIPIGISCFGVLSSSAW